MKSRIKSVKAREILSSGSDPSLEVKVSLESGANGFFSVPYGASAGSHEAFVLLDGDKNRFFGKGMLKAVENINKKIAPKLKGMSAFNQKEIDKKMIELDGTENKRNLGANAILGVSVAVACAAAQEKKMQLYDYIRGAFNLKIKKYVLPNPMMVAIEGGKHADKSTDFQEYLVSPIGKGTVKENVRCGIEVYLSLKKLLKEKGLSANVGNEGAFAPSGLANNELPIALILEAIEKAGYKAGQEVGISLDIAASEIFSDGKYRLKKEGKALSSLEMIGLFEEWAEKYPIIMLEDALHEDDWENWQKLNAAIGKKVAIVADDLTTTNPKRLAKAIETKSGSATIIKLNQIGTLSETLETCLLARKNGWITIISHRGGGETNDTAMVDLAVAVNSAFIKVGPSRGERVCKYNRLMEIEETLGKKAETAGKEFRKIN
ncbi:MAG: phosphopyruvate hydratase [Candidatus ainarchaeum sp.]|nr:phosphopyruvate hydratase [Candidatus ainarchaeum sp.]